MKNLYIEKVSNGFIVREQGTSAATLARVPTAFNDRYVPDQTFIFDDLDDVNDFLVQNFGGDNEESIQSAT